MKRLTILLLTGLLLSPVASANDEMELLQQWITELPNLISEQSNTSYIYLQNYLQCMDDQQALKSQSNMSIMDLINNAVDSGGECSPLLDDLLNELTDKKLDDLSTEEKKKLLENTL
ncbi:hypothetical protein [Neptuniibacter sp.]|uniref:hypothetical protein n=1 Tax=Neptuniibacter sp. TaxID=1962643 RepID=UPI0026029F70|nr:hypothetical protein [Neptuniibacter sp.]MCP4598076.1 hypothetical protein [Neptuniibacter sp.]